MSAEDGRKFQAMAWSDICILVLMFACLVCGCPTGYHGQFCERPCPVTCFTCDSNSECTSCHHGYYGPKCLQICSENCLHGNCSIDGSCAINISNSCPSSTCQTCDESNGTCTECTVGYFGKSCERQCQNCQPGTACDIINGTCDTCLNGYTGQDCDQHCHSSCSSCKRDQRNHCLLCPAGRHGLNRDKKCLRNCRNSSCDIFSGKCDLGCYMTFYYGSNGTKQCYTTFLGSACDQTVTCLTECQPRLNVQKCAKVHWNNNTCFIILRRNGEENEQLIYDQKKDNRFNESSSDVLLSNCSLIYLPNTTYICIENSKTFEFSSFICEPASGVCTIGCLSDCLAEFFNMTCFDKCTVDVCKLANGAILVSYPVETETTYDKGYPDEEIQQLKILVYVCVSTSVILVVGYIAFAAPLCLVLRRLTRQSLVPDETRDNTIESEGQTTEQPLTYDTPEHTYMYMSPIQPVSENRGQVSSMAGNSNSYNDDASARTSYANDSHNLKVRYSESSEVNKYITPICQS